MLVAVPSRAGAASSFTVTTGKRRVRLVLRLRRRRGADRTTARARGLDRDLRRARDAARRQRIQRDDAPADGARPRDHWCPLQEDAVPDLDRCDDRRRPARPPADDRVGRLRASGGALEASARLDGLDGQAPGRRRRRPGLDHGDERRDRQPPLVDPAHRDEPRACPGVTGRDRPAPVRQPLLSNPLGFTTTSGAKKLVPRLAPGKTWTGTTGGPDNIAFPDTLFRIGISVSGVSAAGKPLLSEGFGPVLAAPAAT